MLSPWQLSDSCFTVSIIFAFFWRQSKISFGLWMEYFVVKDRRYFICLSKSEEHSQSFVLFYCIEACFCIWQISIHILQLNINAELEYFVISGFFFVVISMQIMQISCRCKWKYRNSIKDWFLIGKWNLKFNFHYLYFPTKNSENK